MSRDELDDLPEFLDGAGGAAPLRILATINALCPKHLAVMKRWHLIENADGRRVVWSDTATSRELVVTGDRPDDATGTFVRHAPPRYDVAEADHWRELVRCPRPTCPVSVQLRLDGVQANLRAYLSALAAAGIREVSVVGIDRPPAEWRTVSRQ